jgi:hypothetical protein
VARDVATMNTLPPHRRKRRRALLLAAGFGFFAGSGAAAAADGPDPWTLCALHSTSNERTHGLPAQLLTAIGKVEAGRWNAADAAILAWPWTLTADGRGYYLPSKDAAVAQVRALQARGVRNIDVGCMQVNLHYHRDAFRTLEEAFDPARNVGYAARFLLRLRHEVRPWTKAIGRYHSATPELSGPYRVKVFRAWREERQRARRARRAELASADRAAAGDPSN